jgi:hypothetical protein
MIVRMDPFGKSIPVTGPITQDPKDLVWFSEVRTFKNRKSGHFTCEVLHPTNGDEIDTAICAALETAAQTGRVLCEWFEGTTPKSKSFTETSLKVVPDSQ